MNFYDRHSPSPRALVRSFWSNRELIWRLAKRDVIGRYRGSVLGLTWSFFHPLVMLSVYTFVFSFVFQARWNTGSNNKIEFALALFVGMITHGLIAECMNRAPKLLHENISFVKKVLFPLEILPWVTMGSTIFHTLISLLVWILVFLLVNHFLHWTVIFVPIIFLPLILFTMGISWVLAALGVYLRDVSQITGVFTTMLLFLSPVFYPADILPEPYKTIIYLNPLTFIIEQARDVLIWGKLPNWEGLMFAWIVGALVAWLGFACFQVSRRMFADVI